MILPTLQKHIFFAILAILASIFIIAFAMTTYRYYQAIHSDDPINPYLSVEKWQATIARWNIAIDMTTPESYDLVEWDIIITRDDSLAIIAWPDHSLTRLGANSRLTIERMRVADDYSHIELVAVLESGKAWSNIVRTLYPDSRIEFRLPKSGTVAWVRGTIFEINLDANYIHSVDHSVTLSNTFGKLVTLMPGESVMASDIFKKITAELDTAWISLNTIKDSTYTSIRNTQLRATYSILTGKSNIQKTWDHIVRWILSWFSAFRDINIVTAINVGDISNMANMPQQVIMKWYQAFQSKDFVQERDHFRWTIISLANWFTNGDKIIESLTRWALWDMQSSSGITLQNTQILLNNYAQKTGTTVDTILSSIKKIDTNTINIESRILYDRLFQ